MQNRARDASAPTANGPTSARYPIRSITTVIAASKRESHARGFEVVRDVFGIVPDSQPRGFPLSPSR